MIVRSIEVEHFGVLRGPLSVTLGAGVNVISGPNRIGKSTLMRAVHAAMTLRSKITGGVRDRFVPYAGGTPEVTLVLDDVARTITITKRFAGQSGSSTLIVRQGTGATRQLQGAEADDAFYEMMGIRPAGRGAPGDELCGMLPLVWVEQGTSAIDPSQELNSGTREKLRDLLEAETGVALGGADAARVFEKTQAEYGRYYTSAGRLTLSAGSPYGDAKRAFEEAESKLSELRSREMSHASAIAGYASVCRDLERLDAEIPGLRTALAAAEDRVRRIDGLRAAVERAESAQKLAEAEFDVANRRCLERRQLRDDVRQAEGEVSNHRSLTGQRQAGLNAHRSARAQFDESLAAARTAAEQARANLRRLELGRDVSAAREQLHTATTQLETARAQQLAVIAGNEALARLGVNSADIVEIRRLHSEAELRQTALEAAAARVRVKALSEVMVRASGEEPAVMQAGQASDRVVTRMTTLTIGEFAEVEVVPGGADLGTLEDRARSASAALLAKLQQARAASLADAEVKETTRVRLKSEADTAQAILSQVARDGVPALEERAAVVRGTVRRLEMEMEDLSGAQAPDSTLDGRSFESRLVAAQQDEAAAVSRVQDAERSLQSHDRTERLLESEAVASRSAAQTAETQLQTFLSRLTSAASDSGDDARLEELRLGRAQALTSRRGELEAASAALVAESPEDAQRSHTRCSAAVGEADRQRTSRLSERDRLEGQLTSGDLAGLHERRGDAESTAATAKRAFDQQECYARAVKLLFETLTECRTQTQQAFREPLMRRLLPLLRSLHQGASVELDDEFNIVRFARPGVGDDVFGALSGGESEQFGLVVRLALAQVLSERQSLSVMIDDGLVHTDDHRMVRLLDILGAASQSLQLIICTCHPERYRGLARPEHCIDLEELMRRQNRASCGITTPG
jgi:hypothetical protein